MTATMDDGPELAPVGTWGRYALLGRIRSGAIETWRAREETSVGGLRDVALHRVMPGASGGSLLADARLAVQVSHPHLEHVYDYGEVDGIAFVATEWNPGVSLDALVSTLGAMSPPLAARAVADVAAALHTLHRADDALGRPLEIVHRGVRAETVHIGLDGRVTLRGRVPSGDLAPQSPEECAGLMTDGRADVFGLGAVFVEALTGSAPFRRETADATREAIESQAVPTVGHGLDELARRALAKDPDSRFESAGALAVALERWLAEQGHTVEQHALAGLATNAVLQLPVELDRAASVAPPRKVEAPTLETTGPPDRPWNLIFGLALLLVAGILAAVLFGLD
ncbi:MAG: hypothetical protein AB8I08_22450 [Sandaracinaceae bacterium]